MEYTHYKKIYALFRFCDPDRQGIELFCLNFIKNTRGCYVSHFFAVSNDGNGCHCSGL